MAKAGLAVFLEEARVLLAEALHPLVEFVVFRRGFPYWFFFAWDIDIGIGLFRCREKDRPDPLSERRRNFRLGWHRRSEMNTRDLGKSLGQI